MRKSFHRLAQISNEYAITEKHTLSLNSPLAVPLLLFVSGIILGNAVSSYFYPVLFLSILSILSFCHFNKQTRFKLFVVLFHFIFLMGFLLISFHSPDIIGTKLNLEYFGKKNLLITGLVASMPKQNQRRTKFALKILTIKKDNDDQENKIKSKIEIFSYYGTPNLQYGDVISYRGSIKRPRNFANPGGFNYVKYLSFKGIAGISFVRGEKIVIHNSNNNFKYSTQFIRRINKLRHEFSGFIHGLTINSRHGDKVFSILSAVTTGLKDDLPDQLRENFSKAGVSHIIAISGLHLSIIAAIFFFCFNFLFSRFKPLLVRGLAGKAAYLTTLIPLLFYALLSGFSPSTQRAFIMISVYMLSFVLDREKDVLNSLAAAALIILIIDPCALFAISFQLSFSAVLFIVLGMYAIKDILFFKKNNFLNKFFIFILVSFFAGLGTLPLVMYYFNIISFVQVIANLMIIPLIGFIAVPLGLAGFFIFPFSKIVSGSLIKLSIPFLSFAIDFVEYITSFSFSWARCITPHLIELVCFYAIILGSFNFLITKTKKSICFILFFLFLFFLYSGFILEKRYFSSNLQITNLDVGQGNSALIEGPKGIRILVDGGGFSYRSGFDTGKYIVGPFLWYKRINKLDAVILTHPEKDHMNGLIFVLKNFKVGMLIKNSDYRKTKAYSDLMRICLKKNIKIFQIPLKNNKDINIGDLNISFFNPISKKIIMDNFTKNDYNNNSLVFIIKYNKFKILFPGDIMKKTEQILASKSDRSLRSDVLIAPHHGSLTSSISCFLDRVKPEAVIISCGLYNQYHFPSKLVLARYRAKNINFYRTDYQGAVKIMSNGEKFSISTFKGD